MKIRVEILTKRSAIATGDVDSMNELMRQLSSHAEETSRDNILKVIAGGYIAVARDLDALYADGSRIIGMATLLEKRQLMGFFGFIEDVVVDEAYRGQGIAERLNQCLIKKAKRLGMKHLELTSNPKRTSAHRLYDKLGYVDRDTRIRRLLLKV